MNYASATTKQFYSSDLFVVSDMPPDVQQISDELHQELMQGLVDGMTVDFSTVPPSLVDRPAPTRAEVEANAWVALSLDRDQRTQLGGCLAQGHWFHSDTFSRSQWLGLKDQARDILAAGGAMTDPIKKLGTQVYWKTMAGSFVAVTVQLTFDVVDGVGNMDAQVFTKAEQHRAAMVASADPAAYDFSGGWPVNFEG